MGVFLALGGLHMPLQVASTRFQLFWVTLHDDMRRLTGEYRMASNQSPI